MHYSSLDMEFLITYGLLFLQILGTPFVDASGLPHISQQGQEVSTRSYLSQPFRFSRSSRSDSRGLQEKEEITRTISPIGSEIDAHEIASPLKRPRIPLFPLKKSGDLSSSHVTPGKVSNDNPNRFPPTTPTSSLSDGDSGKNVQSLSSPGHNAKDKDQNEGVVPPSLPKAEALKSSNRTTEGTVALRGACNMTEQCFGEHTECRVGICKCAPGYLPRIDNGDMCGDASSHNVEVPQADPTMIGVVVGLAFMSITLCVVLQLFARAQFRENRTIFNTPNPRLMNASLLKGSKTLLRGNSAGQRSRRGSQVSVASGGDEEGGQKVININVEFGGGGGSSSGGGGGHGSSSSTAASAGGGGRGGRNHRQMSTESGMGSGGRHNNGAKGKNFRQDSIGSAALDASSL